MKREELAEIFRQPEYLKDKGYWSIWDSFEIKDMGMLDHISLMYNGVRVYFDSVTIYKERICFYKWFNNGNKNPLIRCNMTYGNRKVVGIDSNHIAAVKVMKDYHEFTGTKSIIFEIVGKERFKVEEDLNVVKIVDTYNENENVVTFWKDDIPGGIDIYDYAEKVCKAMNEDV